MTEQRAKSSKIKSKDDPKASLQEATQKQKTDLIDANILSSANPEVTEMITYAHDGLCVFSAV